MTSSPGAPPERERGRERERERGGVIFRTSDGRLWFVPASVAMKAIPTPIMARVPGGPRDLRGIALVDGEMIPVVTIPDERGTSMRSPPDGAAMLICTVLGERLGLVGIEILATGQFDPGADEADEVDENEIRFGSETARHFDFADLIARVRDGHWAV
jgi:hypothetical protein